MGNDSPVVLVVFLGEWGVRDDLYVKRSVIPGCKSWTSVSIKCSGRNAILAGKVFFRVASEK